MRTAITFVPTIHFDLYEQFLHKLICTVLARDWYTTDEVKEFGFLSHASYPGRTWITHKERLLGEQVFRTEYFDGTAKVIYELQPCSEIE